MTYLTWRIIITWLMLGMAALNAELALPPGVEISGLNTLVKAETTVEWSSTAEELTDRDNSEGYFRDEAFYFAFSPASSAGQSSGLVNGEVALQTAADSQLLEFVLQGNVLPETEVDFGGSNVSSSAESSSSLSFSADLTSDYPSKVTVEVFTISSLAVSTFDLYVANEFLDESVQMKIPNGSSSKRYEYELPPGTVYVSFHLPSYAYEEYVSSRIPPVYQKAGGDLEYLIKITIDPHEDYHPPTPLLHIGSEINGYWPLSFSNLDVGINYILERSPSLHPDSWQAVGDFTSDGADRIEFQDLPLGWNHVFYRLVMIYP